MPERIETTYADLRPTDLVIDKAGNAWPIQLFGATDKTQSFWLLDPATRAKAHLIEKPMADTVTVSRVPTIEEAVANVEAIGGEVEAVVTAEDVDAVAAANDDAPLRPPPFADMTPLEQRSHLYLLHGVIAYDLKSAEELKAMHAQAHAQQEAGTLQSAYIPHTHDGKF